MLNRFLSLSPSSLLSRRFVSSMSAAALVTAVASNYVGMEDLHSSWLSSSTQPPPSRPSLFSPSPTFKVDGGAIHPPLPSHGKSPVSVDLTRVSPITDDEVIRRLSHEERTIRSTHPSVHSVHVNQWKANSSIEDSYSLYPNAGLFGVFDGHSGSAASQFCRMQLLEYLMFYRRSEWTDSVIHPKPIVDADSHFLEFSFRDQRFDEGMSGACLNVLHVNGDSVECAVAGDVRSIVGRRVDPSDSVSTNDTPTQTQSGPLRFIELSLDHQINSNFAERQRLLSSHIDEEDVLHRSRVKGRLEPTRGFGDAVYKDSRYMQHKTFRQPPHKWNPPYTTAEPVVTKYKLHDNDEVIVMGTDGLYGDLTNGRVMELISEWKADENIQKQMNAATYLIRGALTSASEYAIGRRSVKGLNMSWILGLQPGSRRDVHDDITVAVIFLNKPNQSGKSEPVSVPADFKSPPQLQRVFDTHAEEQKQQSNIKSNL